MANIKKLKANGQDIVPITHEQAVLDSNGVTFDSKLNAINNAISRLENNSTSNVPSLEGNALTFGNYTIKYNETDDTLDFIYNGTTEEPEVPPTTEGEVVSVTWNDGKSILDTGNIVDNATAMLSDPITIDNNYNYTIRYTDKVTQVRFAYYDNNNTFISRGDYLTSGAVEFPENTVYVRIKAEKVSITVNEVNDNIILKKVTK